MLHSVVSSAGRRLASSVLATAIVIAGVSCGDGGSEPSDPGADVVVTLTGPAALLTTDTATYTVELRNDGPEAAREIVATLDLLGTMSPVAGEPVTVTGQQVTWPAVATLGLGATVNLTVRVVSSGAANGTLTAHATSASRDRTPGNNDGSASDSRVGVTVTAPVTSTDLRIAFAGAIAGASGTTQPATLQVLNSGTIPAADVVVDLFLPAGIQAVNFDPADGVRTGDRITWQFPSIAAGETRTITLDLGIPLLSLNPINATVQSSTTDNVPANNTANTIMRAVVGAVYTVTGEGFGDNFGWEAEDVGDVNGDGKHDFAITAPENDAGGLNAGRAYVYSGADGHLLYMVTGDQPNGQLGLSMDAVGDIDGDGVSEIAFGAPFASTGSAPGYVLVVSGATGATLFRFNSTAVTFVGYGVGAADDLNGDGVRDVLVGAPGVSPGGVAGAGRVLVISGATGTAVAAVDGTAPNGVFGAGLGTVGDLNNDQVADFVVGASGESGGRVRVYSGADGNLLYPAISVPNGGTLGQYWIFSPGDMNQDGVPDIFAADINNATNGANRGQAYIFSGATGTLIRSFTGESPGDQFGMGRPIGDVTGDGITDFVLAGWLRSEGAQNSGKMYVVDGATGATLRSLVSTVAGETLGFDVIGVGDVTGDGLVDYIITGGQGINQGKAYLIAGVPLQ